MKPRAWLPATLRRLLRAPKTARALSRNLPFPALRDAYVLRGWNQLRRNAAAPPDLAQRLIALQTLHGHQSHAQLGQDLFALAARGEQPTPGYFVEFGASDGITLSNTYLLETVFGWTGLLAEPNPQWHEQLAANRSATISHACIAGRSGDTVEFVQADTPELSTIADYRDHDAYGSLRRDTGRPLTLTTTSLAECLQQHAAPTHIDYLSIDTEGSEYDILSPFDFSAYEIDAITVEHNHTADRHRLHALLRQAGYRRVLTELSRWDDWYIRQP